MNNNIKKICVLATALATSLVLCARPGPGGGPGGPGRGPSGPRRAPMHRGGGPIRGGAPIHGGGGGGHHHHNHHHHGGTGAAIGAGILGGIIGAAIHDAVTPEPAVVETAPVVQPVVVTPAQQVVVTPTPAVTTGHYETRVQSVWVPDRYVDQTTPQGTTIRVFQAGHYEQQSTQEWVTP